MLGSAFFIAMPGAWNSLRNAAYELSLGTPITVALGASQLAPLFTPEVEHWAGDIERWAALYGVDPNLLATVMQIESCGHADISSVAGAQGLFQVMPFHFTPEEVQTDPETNARRGASFLAECMAWGDGNPGRALACYNGGPGVLGRDFSRWPAETQRYYVWGGSIYLDARERQTHSDALDNWLNAGGASLCRLAAEHITDGEVG
jgi:soluble lytic murein transglycosylase-like protein